MGEQAATGPEPQARRLRGRRVMIDDVRGNGQHLRTTWHAEDRVFVVSTWNERVCTSAVRVRVDEAGDLANLLVDGLAEAASPGTGSSTRPSRWRARSTRAGGAERARRPGRLRRELEVWARFARSRWRALVGQGGSRGRPRSGADPSSPRRRHVAA